MRILETLEKLQIKSIALAWVTVTKILVTVIVLGAGVVFSLLATLIISMLARHWLWILLLTLIWLLLPSTLLSLLDGFGLPITSIHQRMPLITPR